MSVAYYVDDSETEPLEIDRKTIEACNDVATLKEWLGGLEDLEETVRMQTAAFHMAPNDSPQSLLWLSRANKALAATGIGITRVRRKLIAMGELYDPRAQQIKTLEEKLLNAKARIAELEEQTNAS